MGFESSNLTAMLIAKAVGTDEIRMITDVSGIYEADPKIFPKAKLINEISYDNAIKAADYGLKLFYAPMLKQASESDVKIYYSNQIVQNNQFTIISKNLKDNNSLIIYKENNIVQPYDSQEMINNKHNILEFIDQSYHLLYENDKNIYFCTHNSLINNNHYSMLIMLYHEIKLIIDCIYENNFDLNEIKIFMPEKDVIHLITRKDIALKIGNILLERM
jgi:aspartokinase